jgi:hypothetical protein
MGIARSGKIIKPRSPCFSVTTTGAALTQLGTSPAVESGLTDHLWSVEELLEAAARL